MESPEDLERFLAGSALFSDLSPSERSRVAGALERRTLRRGEALFEAGSPGDCAFLVRSGLVHVVESTAPGAKVLAEVPRGGHFGELAVFTGEPRAAGAVAAVDSVLYRIPGDLLRETFQSNPVLYARLSQSLMRTLQQRAGLGRRGLRTCALVAAGSATGGALEFALRLARQVVTVEGGKVAVIDCGSGADRAGGGVRLSAPDLPEGVNDVTLAVRTLIDPLASSEAGGVSVVRLSGSAAEDSPVAGLVAELLCRFDRVLVAASLPWSSPVRRCVAQCEALWWLVAEEGAAEALAMAERLYPELSTVVHRPPAARVLRTARVGERGLRSLARLLAGRRTALVLGAGGAKGLAHVGALRAFERHGIEFDAVAGSSIGAIVGALHAVGRPAAEVERILMGVAANPWRTLLDVTVPTEAFFRSKKKSELITHYCKDLRIEDMPIPFFAVAGDLTTLSQVVMRSGPLALALDATSAIPTVFRPVRIGQSLLVDGWVCNPLPADVLRAEGYERIVAVDLSLRGRAGKTHAPRRATGMDGRFRILAVAMRAMEIGSQEHVTRNLPLIDVLVRPDLDEFSSADLDAAPEMCARGEQAVEGAVGEGMLAG